MDIQTVNNIFKDITESLPDFKGYGFGWPSDRTRGIDPETGAESEYPRVFFSVPTVTQDVIRMQDTYSVVLYFDDLQGYDNEGNPVDVTQLGQWSNLQLLAQKWVGEFKSRQLQREVDYLGLVSSVNVVLDSFASSQRLISLQLSFNIVAPSSCGISTVLKLARATLSGSGALTGALTAVKQASALLSAGGAVSATLESGAIILYAEANLTAGLSLTAIGKLAKNASANITAGLSIDSPAQLSMPAFAELEAISGVEAAGQIAKLYEAILTATATISALATSEAQGVGYASALLSAQGSLSASLSISKQLISDLTASGNIQAAAIVARMASAALEANAQLVATAQSVKVAEAGMIGAATTILEAVVSRAVTAQLNAVAQTDLNAIISKALSASVTATASTSLVAVLGNLAVGLLNASATLSATAQRAKLPSATLSASATVVATGTSQSTAATDPYWSSVTLLLRGNSSPITDEKAGYTFSAYPAAPSINTSVKKFGAGSILFSNGGYLYNLTADNSISNFETSAFTVEFWVRFTSVAANQIIVGNLNQTGGVTDGWALYLSATGTLRAYGPSVSGTTTVTVAANTWYHIALTRSGNTFRLFKDGVFDDGAGNVTSFTDAGSIVFSTGLQFDIGGYGNNASSSGFLLRAYIDDLRITRGVARYTTNFTPPTAEFPNS